MFLTAGIASAKYFFHHVSRQNTLTQARRNISRHYDLVSDLNGTCTSCLLEDKFFLDIYRPGINYDSIQLTIVYMFMLQSNELFALFLDETMTYSCAKFKVSFPSSVSSNSISRSDLRRCHNIFMFCSFFKRWMVKT